VLPQEQALPVRRLDGSTVRLRPHGDIAQQFPPYRTGHRPTYWCLARVVVAFCGATALALGAQTGCIYTSEQALAVQWILSSAARALYVGDRNFGVWRVVRACVQTGGHALVRLPRRQKVGPAEPRAAYYPPQVYPRLRCWRAKAGQRLAKLSSKS
jgi:hypothetical protein